MPRIFNAVAGTGSLFAGLALAAWPVWRRSRVGLLALTLVATSADAVPPFSGTIFLDPDIITSADPTTFVSVTYKGQGVRNMFDRRLNAFADFNAFLFDAVFSDASTVEVQVNPEFSTSGAAQVEALKYSTVIGRLPRVLRTSLRTVWIHLGVQPFGGGNNNILIHTGQSASYESSGILEETLVHEAAHTSLDAAHASAAGWVQAQTSDGEFISTYARDNPTREDVAESFLPYLALRYRASRISSTLAATFKSTMPNRIAYFDAQGFNMSPVGGPPRLVNISTRGQVGTGDNVMIGGFIVGGSEQKKVVIRGRGPSLSAHNVPGTLADPAIRLFSGSTPVDFNDNWQTAPNAAAITASGQAPTDPREAAILAAVAPGLPYTVHLTGVSGTTGIAIVEVFELDKPDTPLLNISTRGPVLTGDQVMIGGFIVQGDASQQVLVVAKGPSLGAAPFNVPGALGDPTLELYQAGVATPIETNDNWVNSTNMAAIQATGNAPTNPLESAIIRTLAPGAYTAIVKGVGAFQGIGLVEVYKK